MAAIRMLVALAGLAAERSEHGADRGESERTGLGNAVAALLDHPLAAAAGAGRSFGLRAVPREVRAVDASSPDHVIGDGMPGSCPSPAVVSTLALGGGIF